MSIDKSREIGPGYFSAPNMLCAGGKLETAMQLSTHPDTRYDPLAIDRSGGGRCIVNTFLLYMFDPELRVVRNALSRKETQQREKTHLDYKHLLNLPNNPANVRFRQEGVRELSENDELFEYVGRVLEEAPMFYQSSTSGHEMKIDTRTSPENLAYFINSLLGLKGLKPVSRPLSRCLTWAKSLQEDTVFRELLKTKRKVTDSRVLAVYSERFGGVRYALLKPGVNAEEVFDFLAPSASVYTRTVITKKGPKKVERSIVGFKDPEDGGLVELAVGHARQRVDILNELTSRAFDVPAFLAYLQLQNLYQGARLYRQLKQQGYPAVFPEVDDNPGTLQLEDILPIRMVLENLGRSEKPRLCENSLTLTPAEDVVQIIGPNLRGKSELIRTLNLFYHLFNHLFNQGGPIPAGSARSGVIPISNFVSCKGASGQGGSELERSLNGVLNELGDVYCGSQIFLDELGDSTNDPTAGELGERLIPELARHAYRIIITGHHDSLSRVIEKKLKGLSLMPDPKGRGVKKHRIIRRGRRKVDFKSEEVLDEMEFTKTRIGSSLGKGRRASRPMEYLDDFRMHGRHYRQDDEIPF